MKLLPLICFAAAVLPQFSFAEDFSVNDGREFRGVTVTRVEPDGIVVITDDGVEKLPFKLLPRDVQEAYHYNPNASASADKTADAQAGSQLPSGEDLKKQIAQPAAIPVTSGEKKNPSSQNEPEPPKPDNPGAARHHSLAEAGLKFLVVAAALLAAWIIGRNLLCNWSQRRRQLELEGDLARKFHAAYEDFFAVWKLWNHQREHGDNDLPDHGGFDSPEVSRGELLHTVANAEGGIESIFITLASMRNLSQSEVELLGRFHQAFASLREAITKNKTLAWNDPEHAEYLAFKRLASGVVMLIHGENSASQSAQQRIEAVRQITSSRWEKVWSKPGA